jgi:hypothetical protein
MPIETPISLLTPLRRNLELHVSQAPGGAISHDGDFYYGWDFVATSRILFGEEALAVADRAARFVERSAPDGCSTRGCFGDYASMPVTSLGPSSARGKLSSTEYRFNRQFCCSDAETSIETVSFWGGGLYA